MNEVYWYFEQTTRTYYIGERGGKELKLSMNQLDDWYWKLWKLKGGKPTDEETFRYALKMHTIEYQYIDFEEVKPEIKLLS